MQIFIYTVFKFFAYVYYIVYGITKKLKIMKETISKLVNAMTVLNTFVNLKWRWLDEGRYEDFNEYAKVMLSSVKKATGKDIELMCGTKRPFGIIFKMDGVKLKLFLKSDNRGYWLACGKC